MSLDCYPLGERRLIALGEQPMAIDAAYDDNLLVTVIDDCRTVVIFDLAQAGQSESQTNLKVGHFQLGDNVVIDQVVHCKTGDFIACVGHKEGQLTLYAVFEWRNNRLPCDDTRDADARRMLRIEELNLNETTIPLDEIDRGDKLTSIGVCQETGNLAASYGDLVIIYRYIDPGAQVAAIAPAESTSQQDSSWHEITSSPEDLAKDLDKLLLSGTNGGGHFKHMVSVKLSIFAARVCLAENYLSIMSLDHVQVLKLELLTLQIQSEGQEGGCQVWSQQQQQQQVGRSAGGSSGESQAMALARGQRGTSNKTGGKLVADAAAAADGCRQVAAGGVGGGGAEKSGDHGDRDDDETRCDSSASSSCSLATSTGFGSSNQSLVTNFSSLLEGGDIEAGEALLLDSSGGANCGSGTTAANSTTSEQQVDMNQQETTSQQLISNIDSDMSIITMQNLNQVIPGLSNNNNNNTAVVDANVGQDDCITWNLNTKKLVKLPTLMHNTSTDLSSYHICHPLELLGPASESIACRVSARIYAPDLSQNQLEPVVLLCKQFDFDRDPIKLVQLEPVYLSRAEDQRRLAGGPRGGGGGAVSATTSAPDSATATVADAADCANLQPLHSSSSSSCSQLLKSRDHELLASISCFVATLANCYIYSLNGKKVTRLQTITFPGLCLDLRADLLNVYLLTPLGLQICSTSICDATFRYDWSSSADLNLSFLARDRVRALTTRDHLVMVSSSSSCASHAGSGSGSGPSSLSGLQHTQTGSLLEVMRKPHLGELLERIGHTIQRCQSISVRSNLLTYLHASAQLSLVKIEKQKRLAIAAASDENNSRATHEQLELASRETSVKLKEITIMLAKQLLQKKQTNVITNSRIDKAIKHLMDMSFCDLVELMQRHLAAGQNTHPSQAFVHDASVEEEHQQQQEDADLNTTLTTEDDDDEQPEDSDLELLLIYLRHSKFSQSILDYLKSTGTPVDNDADDDTRAFEKLTNYMFDNNPRLLIKCAQRITRDGARALDNRCRKHLVDKLKQLAEFDSTGINRATVLFTLAILYHQSETSLDTTSQQQQQCLQALSQIKPQNHLAITMCSNYEIIDQSMARLVESHYSQVFRLFLSQLEKRGDLMAARHFQQLIKQPDTTSSALPGTPGAEILNIENDLKQQVDRSDLEEYEDEDEEGEVYEQNLRLLSELSPLELAELFCCELSQQDETRGRTSQQEDDSQAVRALLKASVNLMESRYILARLSENSR